MNFRFWAFMTQVVDPAGRSNRGEALVPVPIGYPLPASSQVFCALLARYFRNQGRDAAKTLSGPDSNEEKHQGQGQRQHTPTVPQIPYSVLLFQKIW